jgi:predicted ATPase/DNA-binding CsgD family transcriptional regulator
MGRAAATSRPGNLPAELTSFVGRRKELSEVKRLLATSRLLTLTGPGGAGKTRLALRAAAEMARAFPDGLWLVDLSPIADQQLVVQAVLAALGLQDTSSRPSLATLCQYLEPRHLLLVLDNCEHVLDAAAVLAVTVLRACPGVQVLATSRQALGTAGETRLRVPPLALPDSAADLTPEQTSTFEAVELLVQRAGAVVPGFKVDQGNAEQVVELCRRLDALPLALELAAVRLEGLSVQQVVRGLSSEIPVLAAGDRGADARQRTLDATLGWSYGLLEEPEQVLWARLAVFAGGFDETAAVTVCSGGTLAPDRIPGYLASMVEKSIVQRVDTPAARYRLLETVRQFGRERLRERGEDVSVARRHRDWIHALAVEVGLQDDREVALFAQVALDLDNVWSALDFCRRDAEEAAIGADIGRLLYPYWYSRGPLGDVRRILDSLYELSSEGGVGRGWCRMMSSCLATLQGDANTADAMAAECLVIARATGDRELIAWAACSAILSALYGHASADEHVMRYIDTVVEYGRSARVWWLEAIGIALECRLRLSQGNLERSVEAGEIALAMCRERHELFIRGAVLNNLSEARRRQGMLEEAEALAREGASGQHALGSRRGLSQLVETLAWMAADRGDGARAATLFGYAESLRRQIVLALLPVHQSRHDAAERSVRERLGDAAYARHFDAGFHLSGDDANAYVLGLQTVRQVATAPPPRPVARNPLSRREMEVARLIAEGLTSQEIATRLFISERTVTTHVTNMLNKLGLNSRVQIAAWVVGLGTAGAAASP